MPIHIRETGKRTCNVDSDKEVTRCQELQIMHFYSRNHMEKPWEIQ